MRLIDADKFEEFIRKHCADSLVELWCELVRRQPTVNTPLSDCVVDCKSCWKTKLVNAPTVEPVRGKWEVATQKGVYTWSKGYARCSACEETVWGGWDMNFCPNCGARMVKDNE